jgi:MFS family permease
LNPTSPSSTATTASLRDDAKIVGWVGTAHGLSHFFQMMLPPLFPVLKEEFGLSYAELGLVTGVFFAVSGLSQTAVGFAVDRHGPRALLVFGLVLTSLGLLVSAAAPSYAFLLLGALIGGLGNATFHPADMALLNAKIAPARLGPAFSLHNIGGFSGFVIGPLFVVAVAAVVGWRWAIASAGLIGLVFTVLLMRQPALATEPAPRPSGPRDAAAPGVALLTSPPILACFGYFSLQAVATVGIMTFGVTAAATLYDVPLVAAAGVLTAFFAGSLSGTLAGGIGAARTTRHGTLAAVCVACGSIALGSIGGGFLPFALVFAAAFAFGFAMGFANPSRDILVRNVTPPAARGRVYGFVYSGMDGGAAIAPLPLGWLLDHGHPGAVFGAGAAALVLALPTVLALRQRTEAARAAPT